VAPEAHSLCTPSMKAGPAQAQPSSSEKETALEILEEDNCYRRTVSTKFCMQQQQGQYWRLITGGAGAATMGSLRVERKGCGVIS
jgi:hypothetical protein